MKSKPLFEHAVCSRCGGSGEYSFNQIHGTRCYGCGGSGYKLTKRGRAAQSYLDALRKKPVEDVKVGDLILFDMFFQRAFLRVERIEPDTLNGGGRLSLYATRKGESWSFGSVPGWLVTLGFTADEKQAQRDLALAYQATLTKDGKPSKRAA